MSPLQRALRTLAQLVVSGALTGLVDKAAGGMAPEVAALVLMGWQIVVTYVHNFAEDAGYLPALAKPAADEKGAVTLVELCLVVISVIFVLWAFGAVPK